MATDGIPRDYAQYRDYLRARESHLASYATRGDQAVLYDGTTCEEYFSNRFSNAADELTLDRNRFRSLFQIDRDRILYSSYFLRLAQKTQILTVATDLVETRLSHTVRVAQIARSLCMGLQLNQDLAEAIALGHDIGHVPFAHRGEASLRLWLAEKLGVRQKSAVQLALFPVGDPPLLAKVAPEYHDAFRRHFTFGNDPGEELFMHGRQSFRLLSLKHKDSRRAKFTRQVLFGIWRHSLSARAQDATFRFESGDVGAPQCAITGSDLTPECQTVRYADDIATLVDLHEAIQHEIITPRELSDAVNEHAEFEDSLLSTIVGLLANPSGGSLSLVLTSFVSDFIKNNLPILQGERGAASMCLSDRAERVLATLRAVVREKLHASPGVGRGDSFNEAHIRALCTWYDANPTHLLDNMMRRSQDPDFPYRLSDEEKVSIANDQVFRCSAICDFISVLTDSEVGLLAKSVSP